MKHFLDEVAALLSIGLALAYYLIDKDTDSAIFWMLMAIFSVIPHASQFRKKDTDND